MNRTLTGLIALVFAMGMVVLPAGAQLVDGEKAEPAPKAETKPNKSLTGEDPLGEADKEGATTTVTKRAFVGVGLSGISRTQAQQLSLHPGVGLGVRNVVPGSAADKGGLEVGDVLHKFDDQILISHQQFAVLVSMKKPGEKVKLTYYHKGKPRTIDLKLGERAERAQRAQPARPAPGGLRGALDNENLTPEQRERIEEALEQARGQLAERGIDLEKLRAEGGVIRLGDGEAGIITRTDGEDGTVQRSVITDKDGNVIGETIVIESVEIEEAPEGE